MRLSDLDRLISLDSTLMFTNMNLTSHLNSAKEDRWLGRNSLLAENLVLGAKGLTQSKKLLGLGLTHSDTSSHNVWVSSKFTTPAANSAADLFGNLSNTFSSNSQNLNHLTTQSQFSPAAVNFNFFENSRMWLTSRYAFESQLRSNLSHLNTSPVVDYFNDTQLFTDSTEFSDNLSLSVPTQLSTVLISSNNTGVKSLTSRNSSIVQANSPLFTTTGDLDVLKSANAVFINKLTSSTPLTNLTYFSNLGTSLTPSTSCNSFLGFRK